MADGNTVRRIARLARVGPGDRVVEIGAGLGSLTLALLETGAGVTAIEVDRHLVPILESVATPEGAVVVHADAMTLDWAGLLGDEEWVLVANLPYNIATPLVLDLLAGVPQIARMLVMVQLEVGERLAAGPGHRAHGIPSVKLQWWATAKVVGKVAPSVFVPAPRVESGLVEIVRHASPVGDEPERASVFTLVETAFNQRRKMLRRSLAGVADAEAFERAGVRPDARAEELTLAEWRHLDAAIGPR
ncbi:MAG: 16S rRNA (adenine(1518)-N(6)/adenine(1519)-N(6))-dimethyltransferase RsmA [Actinomycetota bacterium]|nr:16S rRNA (adenine(1518)-N(6)/adenine(1519)-N(6))-dimethyltransferase RsmA [Actinomycetota bacterium]